MNRSEADTADMPWWLEPGPEHCSHCLRAHHLEVSVRCVQCDQPVCPLCVVTVRRAETIVCPSCHQGDTG